MAKVERGNVQLTVSDSNLDFYLAKGYNVIDDEGNVIQESIPKDLATMEKMYHEHNDTIKALTTKVTELTKENKKLKKQLESKTSDTKNSKE